MMAMLGDRSENGALIVFGVFLLLNSLKVTFYNLYLTNERNRWTMLYRWLYIFTVTTLVSVSLAIKSWILLAVFYMVELIYLHVGMSYFNFYHYYLHILQSWKLIRESLDVVRHRSVPGNSLQLLLWIDLPGFLAIYVLYDQSSFALIKPYAGSITVLCLSLILGFEWMNVRRGQSLIRLIKSYPKSELQVVANYGTLANMLIDFGLFHRQTKMVEQYDYGKPQPFIGQSNKKPNIIIIQAESLDSNAVHLCYKGRQVMPYLHFLAEKSIYYPYMLSYHKAGGTSDAEFSIMNSVEPLSNFPSIKIPSYTHPNSFIRILSGHSYRTAVFHGNQARYYDRDKAFQRMGFDEFYDSRAMRLKDVGWGAPDHDVFNYVLEKSTREDRPFFHYVITMSNHCRFTNVLNYYENQDFQHIRNKDLRNFYRSISYVDHTLQSFVEKMRDLNPETVVMIVGDHTPGLNQNIYAEASLKMESRHLEFVPLFILTPENSSRRENRKAASFLDIAPTVLELANVGTTYNTYGESLLSQDFGREKIPFRGHFFDREHVYTAIKKQQDSYKA